MLLTCFEEVRVAPSSQRDDKAQPGVSASEPLVHSRKCSPSCRDGRVVAAPKGFGVILIGVIRSVSVVARSVFGPFRAPRILSGFPGVRLRSPLAKVCRPIRDKMRASLVKPGCPQVLRHFLLARPIHRPIYPPLPRHSGADCSAQTIQRNCQRERISDWMKQNAQPGSAIADRSNHTDAVNERDLRYRSET
jgi:hypothetical protein